MCLTAARLHGQAASPPGSRVAPPVLDPQLNAAFRAIKAGRYEEARRGADSYLQSADAAHPGQAHFVAGLSYHEQKLYVRASERFDQASRLEPGYFTIYFFQGFALFNLGRLDAAQQAFEKYLAFDVGEAEAHFGLGIVALEQDRTADAERSFERAIELARGGSEATSLPAAARRDVARYEARLADVYLRRNELAPARVALEQAVLLWPEFFEPWHKLATVLRRLGDTDGAERAQSHWAEALRLRQAGRKP